VKAGAGGLPCDSPRRSVLGRGWKRINEATADDDNRDIVDYMGAIW